MKSQVNYIVGIDEAGRGPLAGPVAVGAVIVSPQFDRALVSAIKNKDSKKLNPQKRGIWFAKMEAWKKEGLIDFHVALVDAEIIDQKGISFAITSGIASCLKKIKAKAEHTILLDGSLRAPRRFPFQKTIIRGDEKEYQISLASIAAKVLRDRKMEELSEQYPAYGFEVHKGYGTRDHRMMLKKYGPSEIHRMSFLKRILVTHNEGKAAR